MSLYYNEKQIQKGKEVLMSFLNDSPLKPEWDGMSAYAIIKKIIEEMDKVESENKNN